MEEWKTYKLRDICSMITDGSHFSPKGLPTGYPMLSVKDMGDYDFNYNDCKYISIDDYVSLVKAGCQPHKGDVLVAKDGNSALDHIFLCKETREEVILSSIAIFRPDIRFVLPEFLDYVLRAPSMHKYLKDNCISGSAIPRVVLRTFKDVPVCLPSLDRQLQIIKKLKPIEQKIELNNCINHNLEEQAQALYKSWFVDFEPFKGGNFVDSELGMIPEGWHIGTVEDLSTRIASGGTPKSMNAEYYSGNINWFSTKELKDCFLFSSEKHITSDAVNNSAAKLFPAGTVLMAIYAAPTVGRLGILNNESTFNQAAVGIIPRIDVGAEFIYLTLLSERDNLNNLASGAAQQNLNVGIVKNYKIVVPPTSVLEAFKEAANPIFQTIKTHSEENTILFSSRDNLLPRLMSGEITC